MTPVGRGRFQHPLVAAISAKQVATQWAPSFPLDAGSDRFRSFHGADLYHSNSTILSILSHSSPVRSAFSPFPSAGRLRAASDSWNKWCLALSASVPLTH